MFGRGRRQVAFGTTFRVTQQRGQVLELATPIGVRRVLATVHPSAVLRAPARTGARRSRDSSPTCDARAAAVACRRSVSVIEPFR